MIELEFRSPGQGVTPETSPLRTAFVNYWQRGFSMYAARRWDDEVEIPHWALSVCAVPRCLRRRVTEVLRETGVSLMRSWLIESHALVGHEGQAWLELQYDQKNACLVTDRGRKLLPRRSN